MHILHNARIYTLDDKTPTATAIAIDRGRVLALGDDREILTQFGGGARTLNMDQHPVIPGLIDAHVHLQHYALGLQKIDCEVPTLEECIRRVAERVKTTPPGEWVLGHGWNQNDWEPPLASPFTGGNEGGFPSAADLDKVAPNNPVYLTAKSLHTGWANSAALREAEINAGIDDPADGEIQRDQHGNPTGIFLEGAMWLVYRAIPEPRGEELAEAIKVAQAKLWEMGLTGIHDFDGSVCLDALQRLHLRGELGLRVVKNIPVADLPHARALGLRSGFGDEYLRIGGIKAFTDGALGPHTAAMLQPYENEPENRGMLLLDAEQILEYGQEAASSGLSMTVHAIGDRANHEVLNAFEKLREFERNAMTEDRRRKTDSLGHRSSVIRPLRHRIEHAQLLHPGDAPRLADLGIIASMQPIHATSDMHMADRCWGQRAANAYTWREQLNHGAVLAFGSDAPVESPNPFWGLHAAVTRQRADGSPGPEGWYPEQRLSIEETLRAYTISAAYAAGTEDQQGRLSPGYWADLVVLDKDPFACEPEDLHNIKPLGTMVGGKWVFGAFSNQAEM
ncbi:MAG: amidohydrolase [Anaerolineales bacterium]|nr:amidohydrolase [Anaerolineales bacterium]